MARVGGKNAACASSSIAAATTNPRPPLPGPQLIRVRPADHTRARIESYQLLVEPEHRLHWVRDPSGNRVAREPTFRGCLSL